MMRSMLYAVLLVFFWACSEKERPQNKSLTPAEKIIAQAIDAAGGERYEDAKISFDFRGVQYISKRSGGLYELSRILTDSSGNVIHDKITNSGFERTINDSLVKLPDSLATAYSNSVNSVHYFAQLPYGLQDEAVIPQVLDTVKIAENKYYKIEVTFEREGGGHDHEDIFIYWFDMEDFSMDFLAYEFHTDGGGMRFREAYNMRAVGGIRFADYRNMVVKYPATDEYLFYELDSLYSTDHLKLLSTIELNELSVSPAPALTANSD